MEKITFRDVEFTKEDVEQAIRDLDEQKYKNKKLTTKEQGRTYNIRSGNGSLYGVKRVFECLAKNKGKDVPNSCFNPSDVIEKLERLGFEITVPEKSNTDIVTNECNLILYGPPGTGKTYKTIAEALKIVDENFYNKNKNDYTKLQNKFNELKQLGQIEFVTFHQSYSYEEFVEGIKPDVQNKKISYKLENGLFKNICNIANANKDKKFVLVIDEINRGNISKIFGELITLIEDDKRENLSVTLPYSKDNFTVPKNLHIIGTMNTSDRSIASVDIALRRRFKFKEMMPDVNLVANFNCKFEKCFKILNKRIAILLDRDHQIGHSYFIQEKYKNVGINDLKKIWFDSIIPLLNEYFYGDWEKLQAILGEAKDNDNSFIKLEKIDDKLFMKKTDICETEVYDFNYECNFKEAMKNAFGDNFEEETNENS